MNLESQACIKKQENELSKKINSNKQKLLKLNVNHPLI